jgi:hypothetical protein
MSPLSPSVTPPVAVRVVPERLNPVPRVNSVRVVEVEDDPITLELVDAACILA